MTAQHYPWGCAAESKAPGLARAQSPSDYAWIVNFNNGNSNWNHQNNEGLVRAVRPSECQGGVDLRDLHTAWRAARRGKKPSRDQLAFDLTWIDGLLELQERLNAGTWAPSPSTCFVSTRPKAREIHAPAFADRVVHHWLIPPLEAAYDHRFIHDSYANRRGKGTHRAVERLQQFAREVQSGQGGGWYLQLDIRNYFNRVHRPTLARMLDRRICRSDLPWEVRRTTMALLEAPVASQIRYACTARHRELVPPHKRLENAPEGCGIPIGNLSSQFFANVYLDALDQFVKHALKARRYLRYVDDFVLVHQDREVLVAWRSQIEEFLASHLRLEIKPDPPLRPLSAGIDFLGYIIYPTHRLVRPRVLAHARERLSAWERRHVRRDRICANPRDLDALRSTWSSYLGHLRHANSYRARGRLLRRFDWLPEAMAPEAQA